MIITHKPGREQGFFLAEENDRRMGHMTYEWDSPTRFGKPAPTGLIFQRYIVTILPATSSGWSTSNCPWFILGKTSTLISG